MTTRTTPPRLLLSLGTATTLVWLGAAGLAAGSAYAATSVQLKDSQKGSTASSFAGGSECAGYSSADTLWHFVVPALSASPGSTDPDITSISATFNGGSVTGMTVVQNGKGINVTTTGATAVLDATAALSGNIPDDDAVLVLSHTCVGTGGGTGGDTGGSTGGNTSGGDTTGGNTSGGNTSGGDTSGGNTSGGNTSGGNTSGGNTSGGNTSGGDTSGGNTSGGDGNGNGGGNGGGNGNVDTSVPVVTAGAPVVTTPTVPTAAVPDAAAPITTGGTEGAGTIAIDGAPAATSETTSAAAATASGDATAGAVKALPFTGAPTGLLALSATAAISLGVLMLQAGRMRFDLLFYQGRHVRPRATRRPRLLV